jgi:hypothetical protein
MGDGDEEDEERYAGRNTYPDDPIPNLDTLIPRYGAHKPPTSPESCEGCAMELSFLRWATREGKSWAWIVAHWSDHHDNVDPVIGAFTRRYNDRLRSDEARARVFTPEILDLILCTRGSPALTQRRAYACVDWSIRTVTPTYLRLAGLDSHADALASLPEIVDRKAALSARDIARSAAEATRKKRAVAAAEEAAEEAAWAEEEAAVAAWAAEKAAVAAAAEEAWAAAWAAAEDPAALKRLAALGAETKAGAVALLRRLCAMRDPS